MNRLARLYDEHGQSPWLDNLKRGYLTSGQLASLRDDGIRGLTSNPTIFQKAIQGSPDYDDQFRELAGDEHPILDDYWALVLADINGALDVFAPLYESPCWNSGSLDCASCCSLTPASAISWLAWCGPAARLTCSAGAGLGAAPAAGTGATCPGCSWAIGVTGFGTALDWSGGAAVAVSMSLACPDFPWLTRPLTWPFASPALPDFL